MEGLNLDKFRLFSHTQVIENCVIRLFISKTVDKVTLVFYVHKYETISVHFGNHLYHFFPIMLLSIPHNETHLKITLLLFHQFASLYALTNTYINPLTLNSPILINFLF
jgi:hypothetical protein